jgi:hypothetical protein
MVSSIATCFLLLIVVLLSCNCYEIVTIPDEDIRYLNERLQTKEGMNAEDALNTIIELENFYTATKNGIDGEPSEMIDKAWHAHILNTPMYFQFSETQFGKYIHHLPFWSGNMPSEGDSLDFLHEPVYERLKRLGIHSINETVWTYRYPETTPTATKTEKKDDIGQ